MAYTVNSIKLAHTQYLRQILANVPPHHGETHNTRLWLAVGTYVQVGQYGSLAGWRQPSKEYLRGTKERVQAVHSVGDALAVFIRSSIFLITGNSEQSWGVTKIDDEYGTIKRDTIQVANGVLWFESTDGGVHVKALTPDTPASCINVHITMGDGSPVQCLLYSRPKERKALHFCVHGPSETCLYRTDPSSLKQSPTGSIYACWYCMPLGVLLKRCWVSGGLLYGIKSSGTVYNFDNIKSTTSQTTNRDEG